MQFVSARFDWPAMEMAVTPTIRSRMIKTLALLVASMSLGTLILWLMETDPAEPGPPLNLRAVEKGPSRTEPTAMGQTEIPLQPLKWRNIIIHDAGREALRAAQGCHFVVGDSRRVGDGIVQATKLWRRQADGRHIDVPGYDFNANSVGICVLCDGRRAGPSAKQFESLIALVRALQVSCSIGPDHVYLHSQLGEPGCPGGRFPAEAFRRKLLPAGE
jgi:hypothetical protein